jgi:hypothetical protein
LLECLREKEKVLDANYFKPCRLQETARVPRREHHGIAVEGDLLHHHSRAWIQRVVLEERKGPARPELAGNEGSELEPFTYGNVVKYTVAVTEVKGRGRLEVIRQ